MEPIMLFHIFCYIMSDVHPERHKFQIIRQMNMKVIIVELILQTELCSILLLRQADVSQIIPSAVPRSTGAAPWQAS